MVSRYVTSFSGLPGWHHDRALYAAWNAGDIAHQLDDKPIEDNPFDPETEGLFWRTWRRGWAGISMMPVLDIPPLKRPLKVIKPIIVRYRWRTLKQRLREIRKGLLSALNDQIRRRHQGD